METTYKAGDRVEVLYIAHFDDHTETRWEGATYVRRMDNGDQVHETRLHNGYGTRWIVNDEEIRPAAPIATRPTESALADLNCPTCCRPMRERGEVRVHVWACGCVVRPTAVKACNLVAYQTAGGYDRGWCATGHGVAAEETEHPTEAGAIAAWRTALERRQREDDERAATIVAGRVTETTRAT